MQSTAKGHIRQKQNVFMPQVKKNLIYYYYTTQQLCGANNLFPTSEGVLQFQTLSIVKYGTFS